MINLTVSYDYDLDGLEEIVMELGVDYSYEEYEDCIDISIECDNDIISYLQTNGIEYDNN